MLSIQTPLRISSLTWISQEGMDSGNHFQGVTSEKFIEEGLKSSIQWLDDFLCYKETEEGVLTDLEIFFQACRK